MESLFLQEADLLSSFFSHSLVFFLTGLFLETMNNLKNQDGIRFGGQVADLEAGVPEEDLAVLEAEVFQVVEVAAAGKSNNSIHLII